MVRAPLSGSRLLAAILVLVHVLAGATVIPLGIPLEVKLAIGLGVAASLARGLWRHALLRAPSSVVEIEIRDRAAGGFRTREGEWRDAEILGTSYVTARFTILNFALAPRGRRNVVLLRDSIDAEDFRRLRVLLRWGRRAAGERAGSE